MREVRGTPVVTNPREKWEAPRRRLRRGMDAPAPASPEKIRLSSARAPCRCKLCWSRGPFQRESREHCRSWQRQEARMHVLAESLRLLGETTLDTPMMRRSFSRRAAAKRALGFKSGLESPCLRRARTPSPMPWPRWRLCACDFLRPWPAQHFSAGVHVCTPSSVSPRSLPHSTTRRSFHEDLSGSCRA